MSIRYQKSEAGLIEIATRARGLPPRLRQALIMIDGRKTVDDLRPLLGDRTDELMRALVQGGFVLALASDPLPVVSSAAPARAPSPVQRSVDLEAVKRGAVRTLTELLGPMAEALALKIERAGSKDQLLPLLELGRQSILNTRGAKASEDFSARHIDGL
ncbi:MAG: hypothetical protein IPI03_19920 [Rubrivivax sp.]|nr:hypothetical protein [Rubrivivax sp.]MBK8526660.1 hypothetical protein [Rubrivivax sp.]